MPERLHGLERCGEQIDTDAPATTFAGNPGRAEEAARRRVVAGKAEQFSIFNCDEAGDRLAGKRDGDLARPIVTEVLPYPIDDNMHFGRKRRANANAGRVGFPLEIGERRRIQAHKQVRHAGPPFIPLLRN
ncbi:hypothetical protein D3C72_1949090 [compost metagenome]